MKKTPLEAVEFEGLACKASSGRGLPTKSGGGERVSKNKILLCLQKCFGSFNGSPGSFRQPNGCHLGGYRSWISDSMAIFATDNGLVRL